MSEKKDQVEIVPEQCFYDDQYGWIEAFRSIEVSAETAERWIEEGKAQKPAEGASNGEH